MSEKLELRNFVGGEHVDATDGRRMDLVDPATGEVFATAPMSATEDVDRAYAAAAGAFEGWRDATPSERSLRCSASPTPSSSTPTSWWPWRAATPASRSG